MSGEDDSPSLSFLCSLLAILYAVEREHFLISPVGLINHSPPPKSSTKLIVIPPLMIIRCLDS